MLLNRLARLFARRMASSQGDFSAFRRVSGSLLIRFDVLLFTGLLIYLFNACCGHDYFLYKTALNKAFRLVQFSQSSFYKFSARSRVLGKIRYY